MPLQAHGGDKVEPGPEQRRMWQAIGRYSTIGIEMGLSVALGFAFGSWLDGRLQTQPYLTILFVLFGVVAGFRSLFRIVRRALREEQGPRLRSATEQGTKQG